MPFVSTLVSQGQARIAWTDAIKAQLFPDRQSPPDFSGLDREALYEEAGQKVLAYWKENHAYFSKKQSDRTLEWREKYEQLVERFERGKLFLPLDMEQEAAHWAVSHDEALVIRYWLATMDAEFALRAFVHAWRWDPWGHRIPIGDLSPRDHDGEWVHIRTALMAASDPIFAKARRTAETMRKTAHFTLKAVLSFVFDEGDWAAEDAREFLSGLDDDRKDFGRGDQYAGCLLAVLRDLALVDALAKALRKRNFYGMGGYPSSNAYVPSVLARHGIAAIPILATLLDGAASGRGPVEALAQLVACVDHPDAGRLLVKHLEHKAVRPVAVAYVSAFPESAKAALVDAANGRAKNADGAKTLLRKLEGAAKVDEARESDLPKVLVSPPWLASKKKSKIPTVDDLEELPFEETIAWKDAGEKKDALDPRIGLDMLRGWGELPKTGPTRTKEMDEAVVRKLDATDSDDWFKRVHFVSGMLDAMSDEGALAAWNGYPPHAWDPHDSDFAYVIARFGYDGMKGLMAAVETWPQKGIPQIVRLVSPRVAPTMADAATRLKKLAPIARQWLEDNPEPAAIALIPRALAGKPKERDAPTRALRMTDASIVRKVADRYGADARKAIDVLLAFDPLDDFPAKIPKLPAWFDAGTISSPLLENGKAIPKVGVERIATMLAFGSEYAGLDLVKEACTAKSLAEMSWDIFLSWTMADSPSKEDWALVQLGVLGDDECARRLAPRIREWPGESAHARAVKGLDVLAAIGSDVALMHLDGIAQKVKFKGLQEKAREKIAAVAESRGLTREELGDRLVPDLDLAPDGSKTVDGVVIRFDEKLVPYVKEKKPSKAVKDELKVLKKDAKTIAKNLLMRIERAMCLRRRWDEKSFFEFFIEPPIVHQVIRRLILGTWRDGELESTFRVAEDRTLADAKDETFTLPKNASIGIPHRLELDDALLQTWGQIFGEYELIPPFSQIDREVFTPDAQERRSNTTNRFEKKTVKLGAVLGLEDRGWRRGMAQDAGWIWDMVKTIDDDLEAVLDLKGGILAGDMRESPAEQELGALHLRDRKDFAGSKRMFGSLDAIVTSELFRDIAILG